MLDEYGALLTVQELMETLNIGRNSVYELLNSGEISAFRIGRSWKIPKDSVIYYINQWNRKSK